ncbi:hypothetical protein [Zavarzinella formosa]|uniref:hypothetical protein n=1 Tax=Zavarzinella formosa TaxID=360055 RepID=UPI0002E86283|nr:hypothetical protein [Zavarzinella formosa]
MPDYLESLERGERKSAIIVLWVAVILLAFIELMLIGLVFGPDDDRPKNRPDQFWPMIGIMAFFGVFLFICSLMLYRLRQGTLSSNGVTILPGWLIQFFGLVLLAGAVVIGRDGNLLLAIGTVPTGLAMVFVNRLIRQEKMPAAPQSIDDEPQQSDQ